ncbi:MAG TPA: transposase [Rhodanobacteraceae bacterium]|nr:transposase [Rhodanobacteraceae bacterium]
MPRRPRLQLPGVPLHVTQRGVNRGAIFIDHLDRLHYHELLCEAAQEHAIAVHAYVFMSNHTHLLLTSTQPDGLARAMRNSGQRYVQAFNRRHGRTGTLWQGRFKSCLVNSDRHLLQVYRYIELNPVRAGMCARADDYRWSSVHANLERRSDKLVTPHPSFLSLHHEAALRAERYRAWLNESVSSDDLQRIRAHLNQERALGDPTFQAMVEKMLGKPASLRPRGRPKKGDGGN